MSVHTESRCSLFRLRKIDDVLVVDFADSVDSMNFVDLLSQIRSALSQRQKRTTTVLFNLAQVGFLQSTAWYRLLDFAKALSQTGTAVSVCSAPESFRVIASGHGFLQMFPDEEIALSKRDAVTREPEPVRSPAPPSELEPSESENSKPGGDSVLLGMVVYWPKLTLLTVLGIAATVALMFLAGPSAMENHKDLCRQFTAEAVALQQRDATAAEWNDLHQRARVQLTPIIGELSSRGKSRSAEQTELLYALRSLLEMLSCPECDNWAKLAADVQQRLQEIDGD